MRKTAFKLALFLSPIFLVWIAVETFYRAVPNNYTVKHDYMQANAREIGTLLFGSSHCFYGLNPKYMSGHVYNLANISQPLYYDALLFDQYIDKMPKLKRVVFCIEYSNLSHVPGTGEDDFRKYYYENYMDIDAGIVSAFDPKKYSLAFTRSLEQTWASYERFDYFGTIVDCDANGWGNNYPKVYRYKPSYNVQERLAAHEDGSTDFSANLKRLENAIARCGQRNIEVVIVSLPQSQLYTAGLNRHKLELIYATCTRLSGKYDHVRYLNLFEDRRFTDEDFFDADHLNDVGAIKCTQIVEKFLVK
ncbi:SGNH/GDSL hydrolase family protein [Flavobacterium caeni]|uniref:SGNH/GDSL hydrolase family protein n=1 Tax=Flavobacterium caeni TaxID=490189 RepID=A0A1G5J663_9FLAO|nr:hypothetical protein [Flavobacterium caeni]SCY83856.1 hypothetical protein SAMN02927903_02567 [Flavobacterium caeni]